LTLLSSTTVAIASLLMASMSFVSAQMSARRAARREELNTLANGLQARIKSLEDERDQCKARIVTLSERVEEVMSANLKLQTELVTVLARRPGE